MWLYIKSPVGCSSTPSLMSSCESSSLKFRVTRKSMELVAPEKPTPHECKLLSDIDDQESLRYHVPVVNFYGSVPSMEGKDPAKIIRESLAAVLVFYYPLAGRLRELPGGKLMVECTGEGALFIEADADVMLQDFGEDGIHPPIPCLDELIYDVPGSSGLLNCPLLLIQVTRLICGGFILAIRISHTLVDAFGFQQFMSALSEIARGATAPSILPVWQRELLSARHPPRITHVHHEYDQILDTNNSVIPQNTLVNRSFLFGPKEISILRKLVMCNSQKNHSSFNLVAACVWRCRTIALKFNPDEEVRFLCLIGVRPRFHPPIPAGYYGNAFVYPAAISKVRELCGKNLEYGVELISRLKTHATKEYVQSVADFMVLKGRPSFSIPRTYVVSDNTKLGFGDVDFGWGKAVHGGVGIGEFLPGVVSFYIPLERKNNNNGGKGILVPISLPAPAMEVFEKEVRNMLNDGEKLDVGKTVSFRSAL